MTNQSFYWVILVFLLAVLACDNSGDETGGSDIVLEELADLPAVLDEASGLIIGPGGNLIAHNDKGPYLYEFDFSGNLIKTIEVTNASNEDWEDISLDQNGDIYIGDTGNNLNDRDDLVVYKIKSADYLAATESVEAEAMPFAFEDQVDFPPAPGDSNFDCEAMTIVNNTICLFTRDRTEPFRGTTRYYQLIGELGVFQSTYNTSDQKSFGALTAAALSPDGSKLALVSNRACWIASNFSGVDFFSVTIAQMDFNLDQQIEGAFFQDNCNLLLVDEKNGSSGGKLYRADICP